MAYNSGLITGPVSVYDIQRALGVSECQIGALCIDTHINKWAKFKPFRCNKLDIMPQLDSSGFPVENMTVGSHYRYLVESNCGLSISFTGQSLANCIQKTISIMSAGNDDDVWTYLKPQGGANSPGRIVDFVGYLQQALPFLWQSNLLNKKVVYRGAEQPNGVDVDFFIEIYNSDHETVQGMIEADDLQGVNYNSDNLFYFVAICNPNTWTVWASSVATSSIGNGGTTAPFNITRNNSGWVITGNVATSPIITELPNLKIVHMLAKKVSGSLDSYLPIPYSVQNPPITNLEVQTTSTSVQFDIQYLATFASNGTIISQFTPSDWKDITTDIEIVAWSGITVKLEFHNTSSSAITVNLGEVYCQTNCHVGATACTAIYDSSYNVITSRMVTVPAKPSGSDYGSVAVYLTFADVFDFDNNNYTPIDMFDVELSFWGEDNQGQPTINVQSFGGDGSIIYRTN